MFRSGPLANIFLDGGDQPILEFLSLVALGSTEENQPNF
jgi:hypothetical protein